MKVPEEEYRSLFRKENPSAQELQLLKQGWRERYIERHGRGFGEVLARIGFRLHTKEVNTHNVYWVGKSGLTRPWREGQYFGRQEVHYDASDKEMILLEGDYLTGPTIISRLQEQGYHFPSVTYSGGGCFMASMDLRKKLLTEEGLVLYLQAYHQIARDELSVIHEEEKGIDIPTEISLDDKIMRLITAQEAEKISLTLDQFLRARTPVTVKAYHRPRTGEIAASLPEAIRQEAMKHDPKPDSFAAENLREVNEFTFETCVYFFQDDKPRVGSPS